MSRVSENFESSITQSVYTLTYTNYCFALNYNSITLKEVCSDEREAVEYYTISLYETSDSSNKKTIKAYNYNGEIEVNITGLIRIFFDDIINSRCKDFTIDISTPNEQIFNVGFVCLFGTFEVGERLAALGKWSSKMDAYVRHITWFKNYPTKVSLFTADINTIEGFVDDSSTPITFSSETGENSITDLSLDTTYTAQNCLRLRIYDPYEDWKSVFDKTFNDFFMYSSPYSQYIFMNVDTRANGIFLRWIDKHGLWFSYLFDKGEDEQQVERSDERISSVYVSNKTGGMQFKSTHPVSVSTKRIITCSAQHLDEEAYEDCKSVLTALYVEMYVDGEFKRVNVSSTSCTTNRKKVLNDLEIQIETEEHSYTL